MAKTLVLGLGNPIVSDDAIGIRVVEELRNEPWPSDVEFTTASVGGMEILDVIDGYDTLILVDAYMDETKRHGEVISPSLAEFARSVNIANPHDTDLPTALALGTRLGYAVPKRVVFIGVIVRDVSTFSSRMSDALEKEFPAIIRTIRTLVKEELCMSEEWHIMCFIM